MEYLKREFDEPYEIIDWYIDDGISGTTGDDRVEFQRAVTDMKIGKINCIPCKTLSRAFRNYADQGYYLEQIFPTYNLRFISIGSDDNNSALSAPVTYIIANTNSNRLPDTGHLVFMTSTLGLSILSIATILVIRKKRRMS